MGIRPRKNDVLVSLNQEIYSQEAISQAIDDFKDACEIEQTTEGLVLTPKDKIKPQILGYEFSNYVLGLMKNS